MSDLSQLSGLVAEIQIRMADHARLGTSVEKEWKTFGRAVRLERERRGVSLRKMALAVGITKSSLDYRELGRCAWTVAEAKRAIKYFENVKSPEPVEAAAIEVP